MDQVAAYVNMFTPAQAMMIDIFIVGGLIAAVTWFRWIAPAIRRRRMNELLPFLQDAANSTEELIETTRLVRDTNASIQLRDAAQKHIMLSHCAAQLANAAAQVTIPTLPPATTDESDQHLLSRTVHLLAQPEISLLGAAGDGAAATVWMALGKADLELLVSAASELKESGIPQLLIHLAPEAIVQNIIQNTVESVSHSIQEHGLSLTHIVEDLYTHANESLDHLDQAQEHLEGAFDTFSAADIHMRVPVITLLTSAIREIDLLANDRTSIERSIGHIALDTGAVAGGAFAGGKIGAVIGTAIAPGIGTMIGGVIGGLFGGMGGRAVANNIKMAPLHDAISDYRSCVSAAAAAQHDSAICLTSQLHISSTSASTAWDQSRNTLIDQANTILKNDIFRTELNHLLELNNNYQAFCRNQISDVKNKIKKYRPKYSFFQINPVAEYDDNSKYILSNLNKINTSLDLSHLPTHPLDTLYHLARRPWPHTLTPSLQSSAQRLTAALYPLIKQLHYAEQKATAVYRQSVHQILSTAESETTRHVALTNKHNINIKTSIKEVNRHKAALGIP